VTTLSFHKLAARIVTVLLSCVIGLVVAEVLLRIVSPPNDRYYVWMPNQSAELRPMPNVMPGVGPLARFHVNSQGIIGQEWGAERDREYRILTVGGSTTECLYLDQEKSWPALVQTGLKETADGRKVWVGNLGKAGHNSRDHLALMRLAIHQYDVDAVVILLGGNDMVHRLLQGDEYDPNFVDDESRYKEWIKTRFAAVPVSIESEGKFFFRRAALWQLVRRIRRSYNDRYAPIVQDNTGDWLVELRGKRQHATQTEELPLLETALDEFERNVTAIVQEARRNSLRVVLLTQPTIWRETMTEEEDRLLWMGWRSDREFYSTAALAKAMEFYNQRLRQLCLKMDVECVDTATRLPRSLEVFYDDMHFNERGAQLLADQLTDYFRNGDRAQLRVNFKTAVAKTAPR
jgi:lysophospholipase L1-like esterase